MPLRRGYSDADRAAEAVAALRAQLWQENLAFVMFFASPRYDRDELAKAIAGAFPGIEVFGCTTAGEITTDGYQDGTISGASFGAGDFKVSAVLVPRLAAFSVESGSEVAHAALAGLGLAAPSARAVPAQIFSILLIDGMSKQEELVVSSLNRFLDPIPLFGGSAGDNLDFGATWIYAKGAFHPDAAVLALVQTNCPFSVFKFDHFQPTDKKMVVTEADPNRRLVTEINAERAAPAYARIVGLDAEQLSPLIFASYPVVVKVGGEYHVRAIQKVEDDGSLRFYCGIDEGLVLTVADGADMAKCLEEQLSGLDKAVGEVDMILGFDCILRRLEAQQKQKFREVSSVLKRHKVVGFSTYGEQFKSMHVNQTFTGVAIGRARVPA
jgi:hypothetical protein